MSSDVFERWNIPTKCPVCGADIKINDSGFPYCPNDNCKQKHIHRLARFFKVLDIKGAGEAFIENFVNSIETTKMSDVLTAIINACITKDVALMNGCAGGINGEKIIKAVNNRLNDGISISELLALFDYDGFDVKKLVILDGFELDKIFELTYNDIIKFDGFAEITSNMLCEFLKHKEEILEVAKLVKIKEIEKMGNKFEGKIFVFTGAANAGKRADLEAMVTANGGKIGSAVNSKTTYLVTDNTDSGSSKNKRASELGIPVITSFDFVKMAQEG